MSLTDKQVEFFSRLTKIIIEQRSIEEINKEVIQCLGPLMQFLNSNEPSIWKLVILRVIHEKLLEVTESIAEEILTENNMI